MGAPLDPFRHFIRYPLEALFVWFILVFFRSLSIDHASAAGGWIVRNIGPHLAVNRVAERNLKWVFPRKSPEAISVIIGNMWENLGRVAGEFAHLDKIKVFDTDGRVRVEGAENVARVCDGGNGGIYFSGHLGNWEIASLGITQQGVPLTHIYRQSNNPYVEQMLQRCRQAIDGVYHPKGAAGAKKLVSALRGGGHLAMLLDQKLNDGVAVPFFGRDAMTATALAQLALKFRCPVIPVRVERLQAARFRLTLYPPMVLPDTGDRKKDVAETMRRINVLLESWIRERPEQWLWIHRRWPD